MAALGLLITNVFQFFYSRCPRDIIELIGVDVEKISQLCVDYPYRVLALSYLRGS
jgi:hypothetical protein